MFRHAARLVLFAIVSIPVVSPAANLVTLQFGPCWPQVLLKDNPAGKKTAGDATASYGIIVDKRVAVGICGNFIWNRYANEVRDSSNPAHYDISKERKSFMFPISAILSFDPAPQLIIHPSISGQIGYNSLIFFSRDDTANAGSTTIDNGYYFGVFGRLLLDANYNLADNTQLCLGASYQWANTKNRLEGYAKRDMSAFGIHAGLKFIL
jgi:hypothetical protein